LGKLFCFSKKKKKKTKTSGVVFLFPEQGKEKAGFGLSKGHIQRITKKLQ
jgi:hypothetical protein